MRVLIKTERKNSGWVVSYLDPESDTPLADERVLTRCSAPRERFPLPPPGPKPPPAPPPPNYDVEGEGYKLCVNQAGDEIQNALESVSRADFFARDVQRFGRYLFEVLLGANWEKFAVPAVPAVELELMFESDDQELASLPWEMMWGPRGALGAQNDRKVAITRIIQLAAGKPVPDFEAVQLPLRVLFIVGKQIDDALRPGAELIGILRRFMLPKDREFRDFQTTDLYVRYITEAAWDEIEAAAKDFQPTVVHIVSHGELDPEGGRTRLLFTARSKEGDPRSEKTNEPYRCSAERLLALLGAGKLPPVIVVNACHTAESTGSANAAEQLGSEIAFGAELVRGGVALALGMSGEVTDRACQIFTARFYQALLQELPVPLAAANGRRAALLEFPVDLENMEWARPTIFMARGINPVLRLKPAERDIGSISRRYRRLATPEALCDRYDCLQKYEEFSRRLTANQGQTPVMAFTVKDPVAGVGKTRLLEELAANSVFDNFLPVIVRNSLQNPAAPRNFLEVARQMAEGIREARENFKLPEKPLTKTDEAAYQLADIVPTPNNPVMFAVQRAKLAAFLNANSASGPPSELPLDVVADLIRADCQELLEDASQQTAAPKAVLMLLDDLHRYTGMSQLLLAKCREFGLGKASLIIPVVFTYVALGAEGKALEEALRQRADVCTVALGVFESAMDYRLAIAQFVLSQHKLALSSRKDTREAVDWFYEDMKEHTGGRPARFWDPEVAATVKVYRRYKALVDADFGALLSKWK